MNQRKNRRAQDFGVSENSTSESDTPTDNQKDRTAFSEETGGVHGRYPFRKLFFRNQVLLVTDKKRTPMQDLRHRRRIYNVIQASRIPLIILAGISWMIWHAWPLALILFIISVPLPWVAVVIANGQGAPRDKRERNVYKPGLIREQNQQAELEAQRARELNSTGGNQGKEVDIVRQFDGVIIDSDDDSSPTKKDNQEKNFGR